MYAGEKWSVEGLIRKINIKSRTLDGRKIIQGMTFFLENGETKSVGMDMNDLDQVDVLVVPPDQHIRDFIIRSDSYIDAIGFETNQGQTFGLIAGTRGEGPMGNEAGIGCFSLNPVQGALLLGQQSTLHSLETHTAVVVVSSNSSSSSSSSSSSKG